MKSSEVRPWAAESIQMKQSGGNFRRIIYFSKHLCAHTRGQSSNKKVSAKYNELAGGVFYLSQNYFKVCSYDGIRNKL